LRQRKRITVFNKQFKYKNRTKYEKTPIVLLVIAIAIIAVGVWYTLNQKNQLKNLNSQQLQIQTEEPVGQSSKPDALPDALMIIRRQRAN